jgi:hypothetical protein
VPWWKTGEKEGQKMIYFNLLIIKWIRQLMLKDKRADSMCNVPVAERNSGKTVSVCMDCYFFVTSRQTGILSGSRNVEKRTGYLDKCEDENQFKNRRM